MMIKHIIVFILIIVSSIQAGVVSGTVRDKDTQKGFAEYKY